MVLSYRMPAHAAGRDETHTICGANQYVHQCGNYIVGTFWLKGFNYTTENQSMVSTGNYFDSGTDPNITNSANLRNFFRGEDISYVDEDQNVRNANFATFKKDRNKILETFCNPLTTSITCQTCPGIGKTPASTVRYYTYGNTTVLSPNPDWQIYTRFDCAVDTYSDSTGEYEYVDNTTNDHVSCYYNTSVTGTLLTSVGNRTSQNNNSSYYYN